MGETPRFRRSSGLRLLARLAALLAALCVLCLSRQAHAATAAVPMCGERAESVAAPPIFRVHDGGSLAQAPCQTEEMSTSGSLPLAPQRLVIDQRPERVLAFGALCMTQAASARLPVVACVLELERPGFTRFLERPPRA